MLNLIHSWVQVIRVRNYNYGTEQIFKSHIAFWRCKSELQFGVTVVNLWRRFKGRVDGNLRHISVVDVLVAVPNTID